MEPKERCQKEGLGSSSEITSFFCTFRIHLRLRFRTPFEEAVLEQKGRKVVPEEESEEGFIPGKHYRKNSMRTSEGPFPLPQKILENPFFLKDCYGGFFPIFVGFAHKEFAARPSK